ncbi:MAG TPA: hypothetical protein VFV66_14900 [Nonomuraea sp.]|nr:hypothetical protein [Nonomuraea sp.]
MRRTMLRRRVAVLGAACALALTGLGGSALADEPTAPAGAKVTCTTGDGRTVELPAPEPGEPTGVLVTPDGEIKKIDPGTVEKALPAHPLREGAEPATPDGKPRTAPRKIAVEAGEIGAGEIKIGKAEGGTIEGGEIEGEKIKAGKIEISHAVPADAPKPPEGAVARTIICKKSE